MMEKLDRRTYKYKKAKTRFFCPLCRTERAFTLSPRMTRWHWLQVFVTSVVISIFTFPYLHVVSFASFFLVWGLFELSIRLLFRKQIPCPHCGFDASWYKRDVKVARRLVAEFWKDKMPENMDDSNGPEVPNEASPA